jgi:hypothetical protein
MVRRLAIGLGCAVVGWAVGAAGGGLLVDALSSNVHDRSTEAAMTGAFFIGPLFAVIGFAVGVARGGRRA